MLDLQPNGEYASKMGTTESKEENAKQITDNSTTSTGFHLLEVHFPTLGMGLLVTLFIMAAAYFLYRQGLCHTHRRRRHPLPLLHDHHLPPWAPPYWPPSWPPPPPVNHLRALPSPPPRLAIGRTASSHDRLMTEMTDNGTQTRVADTLRF